MTVRQEEQQKIDRLRYLADRLKGDQWVVENNDDVLTLISFRYLDEGAVLATFHREALPHEIEVVGLGLEIARTLLDVGDRAGKIIKRLRDELGQVDRQAAAKNYMANAAMTLKDGSFWRFLEATTAGGPVRSETAAETRMKSVLKITSKTDLNKDPEAARRWVGLRRDYETWKGQGQSRR